MNPSFLEVARVPLALIAGLLIGYAFGLMQAAAVRRQERLHPTASPLTGSVRRTVFLVVALLLVQFVCPMFFVRGTQWLVSAGVLLGYGWILFWQLRRRLADTGKKSSRLP